jgi:hypothetical protein
MAAESKGEQVGINENPMLVVVYATKTGMNTFAVFPKHTFPYEWKEIQRLRQESTSAWGKSRECQDLVQRAKLKKQGEDAMNKLNEMEEWICDYERKHRVIFSDNDEASEIPLGLLKGKHLTFFTFPNDNCS